MQCLLIRGLSTLLIHTCIGTAKENLQLGFGVHHVPRKRELIFLNSENGKILITAHNALELSTERLRSSLADTPLPSILSLKPPVLMTASLSPYHKNLERLEGWAPTRYYCGQLSVLDLRDFRKHKWQGMDMGNLLDALLRSFEKRLSTSNTSLLVVKEILAAILILSDLFSMEQFKWMGALFVRLTNSVRPYEDTLLLNYLTLGVCKVLAVLDHDSGIPLTFAGVQIKLGLESANLSSRIAAINAVLMLTEANVNHAVGPLLPTLFKHTTDELSGLNLASADGAGVAGGGNSLRLHLHLLALTFTLIEHFPKESEEMDFTKRALDLAIKIAQDNATHKALVHAIFKGFDRLLISFSLSHTHRKFLSEFAMGKLPATTGPTFFLCSLGLMLTCMYTERDAKQHQGISKASKNYVEGQDEMADIERVKILFGKIQYGSPFEAEAVTKILPRVLLDFFRVEQTMTLLLGEFVKVSTEGYPTLLARILFQTFEQFLEAKMEKTVFHWVVMCLGNFTHIIPASMALWAMTCLFVGAQKDPMIRQALRHVVNNPPLDYFPPDHHLFLISALSFYRSLELTSMKNTFCETVKAVGYEPFPTLWDLCMKEERKDHSETPPAAASSSEKVKETTSTKITIEVAQEAKANEAPKNDEGTMVPNNPQPQGEDKKEEEEDKESRREEKKKRLRIRGNIEDLKKEQEGEEGALDEIKEKAIRSRTTRSTSRDDGVSDVVHAEAEGGEEDGEKQTRKPKKVRTRKRTLTSPRAEVMNEMLSVVGIPKDQTATTATPHPPSVAEEESGKGDQQLLLSVPVTELVVENKENQEGGGVKPDQEMKEGEKQKEENQQQTEEGENVAAVPDQPATVPRLESDIQPQEKEEKENTTQQPEPEKEAPPAVGSNEEH